MSMLHRGSCLEKYQNDFFFRNKVTLELNWNFPVNVFIKLVLRVVLRNKINKSLKNKNNYSECIKINFQKSSHFNIRVF